MRPALRRWGLRLSLAEREEISRGLAADLLFRAIVTGLGRSPSTVSREVTDNGGRGGYRVAWSRAQRPEPTKLSRLPGLAAMVEELGRWWSPQ